jgi:hypothetical protein
MELFIPGLVVLLIAGLFAFVVLPRVGAKVLVVISLLALIGAGLHHYAFFASEYRLSTWQYSLAAYAPFIVLGLAILFILAAIGFLFMGSESKKQVIEAVASPLETIQERVANAAAAMPSAESATNPITAAVNTGLNAMGVGGNAGAPPAAPAAPGPAPPSNRGPNNRGPNNRGPGGNGKSPVIPGLGFRASEI